LVGMAPLKALVLVATENLQNSTSGSQPTW
jgi:hypothetical protein